MARMRTVQSFSKRFRRTASGDLKFKHSNLRHILTKKSSKRKRHLRARSILRKSSGLAKHYLSRL